MQVYNDKKQTTATTKNNTQTKNNNKSVISICNADFQR